MEKSPRTIHLFSRLIRLDSSIRYEILFMISTLLYHSLDYFYKAPVLTENNGSVFSILEPFNSNFLLVVISIILIGINLHLLVEVLHKNKEAYRIEIGQKIIFPFQVYFLIRIFSTSNEVQRNFAKGIFVLSFIYSLIIIWLKSFKLNLRYTENTLKGFNRLFKTDQCFIVGKLALGITLGLFAQDRSVIYIIGVGIINLGVNILFFVKLFYEDSRIEYLASLNQLYVWLPLLCQLMKQNQFDPISTEILYFVGVSLYFITGITKPQILVKFLQKKYLRLFMKLNRLNAGNNKEKKLNQNLMIGFLSVIKRVKFQDKQNGITWSQSFKTEMMNLYRQLRMENASGLNQITKTLNEKTSNEKLILDTSTKIEPNTFKKSVTDSQIPNQTQIQSSQKFIQEIILLLSAYHLNENKTLCLWLCYNLPDSNTVTRQQLFWIYYDMVCRNNQKQKNRLEKSDTQRCYNMLMEKIGRQVRSISHKTSAIEANNRSNVVNQSMQECKDIRGDMNKSSQVKNIESKEVYSDSVSSQIRYCLKVQTDPFDSMFNDAILSHSILHLIFNTLSSFVTNEYFFQSLLANKNHHQTQIMEKVAKYVQKRHQFRVAFKSLIKDFSEVRSNQVIIAMLEFIAEKWTQNNPLTAYRNLTATLQNLFKARVKAQNKYRIIKSSKKKHYFSNDQKLTCILSGVDSIGRILIACNEFSQLMELSHEDQSNYLNTCNDEGIENQCQSKTKQTSTNKSNVWTHKSNISSLILPLWKQPHEQLLKKETNFFIKPVDHLDGKYFMISSKKNIVLQVKFRMYFSMMYEKDLLIVMDLDYQIVKQLRVADAKSGDLLFSHVPPKKSQNSSKLSQRAIKEKNSKILYLNETAGSREPNNAYEMNRSKLQNKKSNFLLIPTTQQSTTLSQNNNWASKSSIKYCHQKKITLFNKDYIISVSHYDSDENKLHVAGTEQNFNYIGSKEPLTNVNWSSRKQFEQQESALIVELKFAQFKEKFSESKKYLLLGIATYFLATLLIMLSLAVSIAEEKTHIEQLIHVVNDKMLMEDDHAKEDFYKAIDLGMLINVYEMHINLALLQAEQTFSLFSHVLSSIKNSIQNLKARHHLPLSIQKQTLRTQHFYQSDFIKGYSKSFEYLAFEKEMSFLQFAKNFISISEIPGHDYSFQGQQLSNILILLNFPKSMMSSMQTYHSIQYLMGITQDQDYYFNKQQGIFMRYEQQQNKIFATIIHKVFASFILILSFILIMGVMLIYVVFKIVQTIASKYLIMLDVSQNFIQQFTKSTSNLQQSTLKIQRFTENQLDSIVKPGKQRKQFIETKFSYLVTQTSHHLTINKKGKQRGVKEAKKLIDTNNLAENSWKFKTHSNKFNKMSTVVKFYAQYLRSPVIRMIIMCTVFSLMFYRTSTKISSLETFCEGIMQLSNTNLTILYLMSMNLFILNIKSSFSSSPESDAESRMFMALYDDAIKGISSQNKIQIINKLFFDQGESQTADKVLYGNLCQQFKKEVACPEYMHKKIKGMYQKYGQTIMSINFLFHKLIKSDLTVYGTLDTSKYQMRYIDAYENINELMYMTKQVRTIAFNRLQQFVGVSISSQVQKENYFFKQLPLMLVLATYMILQIGWLFYRLIKRTKAVQTEFLRIQELQVLQTEGKMFKEYGRYLNMVRRQDFILQKYIY